MHTNRIITGQKSGVCFPKIAFHAIKSLFSFYIYIHKIGRFTLIPGKKIKLLKRVDRFDNSYEGLIFLLDQFTLNFSSPFINWETYFFSWQLKSINTIQMQYSYDEKNIHIRIHYNIPKWQNIKFFFYWTSISRLLCCIFIIKHPCKPKL